MINFDHVIAAYQRGHDEALLKMEKEMEKEIIKERKESYNKGFRDGQEYAFDKVRRVVNDE